MWFVMAIYIVPKGNEKKANKCKKPSDLRLTPISMNNTRLYIQFSLMTSMHNITVLV